MKMKKKTNSNLTIKSLLAMTMADIDIFLLQEEDQKTDKKKDSFTKQEIRDQLEETMKKVCRVLQSHGCNIDEEIKFSDWNKINFESSIHKSV